MKIFSRLSGAGPAAFAAALFISPIAAVAQGAPGLPSVITMTAEQQDFLKTVRLPGRIKASTVAEVRPQVSGIIRERLFEEGSMVEKGQPLYKIEDETYAAALAEAEAAVAQAEADYALARRDAKRYEELFATRTGSEQQRDSTIARRDSAWAAMQMAKAQLQNAEINLDRTTIRAPISGTIGLSQSTPGSLVSAQQANALSTIRTLDPIYVDVTQSANELLEWDSNAASRHPQMPSQAKMILPNRQIFDHTGELRAAEPQVEPTTGMVTLRIAFPNPDYRLLPGLYVEVELPQVYAKDAVLLPKNVVTRDAAGNAKVWVVEDGVIGVRPVEIMTGTGNEWVITGGLTAGDKVVTSGFQKVGPGAKVEIASPETPRLNGAAGAPNASEDAKGE